MRRVRSAPRRHPFPAPAMTIPFAALMCHAPIVVPAVGGAESARCAHTTRAMRELAARAVAHRPDRIVLISPHTPRHRTTLAARVGPHRGSLAAFRAPQVVVDLPDAPEVARALGIPGVDPAEPLDHGAVVPLSFLVDAGWRGPTAILALPWVEGGELAAGRAIAALPGRTVVIASGDMSHALRQDAPSGFHPHAHRFDEGWIDGLRRHAWARAVGAAHRDIACEDVVASTSVAMAAVGGPRNDEVLSYEAPWGVGYGLAVLYDDAPPPYAIARAAMEAAVRRTTFTPPRGGHPAKGVFVTLRKDGDLRGCIGHISPVHATLEEELAEVGPLSALEDPRFPPVTVDELADLDIEVSLLEPPERIDSADQLDPRRYGVIVSHGARRGLLLPDLDGVDSVAQQIDIARRKAGIPDDAPLRLERFVVTKVAPP